MPLSLARVVSLLGELAPLAYAENWDNVGLILSPLADRKDPGAEPEVRRLLLCIDLTEPVLDEALAREVDLVVAYHPPLFRAVQRLRASEPAERLLVRAARAGLAVYSPHTALDTAPGGMNDWLAASAGAGRLEPLLGAAEQVADTPHKLVVFVPEGHAAALRSALAGAGAGVIGAYRECSFELRGEGTFLGDESTQPAVGERGRLERVSELRLEMVCPASALAACAEAIRRVHPYEEPAWEVYPLAPRPAAGFGMGRSVTLAEPSPLDVLVERVKQHLERPALRVAASNAHAAGARISHVAVCAGSGRGVFERARPHDLYVTGELSHHDALSLVTRGASVILCEHSSSERGYLPVYAARIAAAADGALETVVSERDREPFEIR